MKIEIIDAKSRKCKDGSKLVPGDVVDVAGEVYLVIPQSKYLNSKYTGYCEPWAISLHNLDITYLNPDEEYALYEQVSPAQFRILYE